MCPSAITLRLAKAEDALEIASIFSASRALLSFLPRLHTQDEERWFIEKVVLAACTVTLAEIAVAAPAFWRAKTKRSTTFTAIRTFCDAASAPS